VSAPSVHPSLCVATRLLLALPLAALLLACRVSPSEVYEVNGTVRGVDAAKGLVQIEHEEIPGFMPAMTMSFDVASADLLEGVTPGARVRFTLERSGTKLRITELEVVAPGAAGETGLLAPEAPEEAFDFRLVDQRGLPLSLSDLRGRAVLLDFVFTRCSGPCPILTTAHVGLQRRLPRAIAERTHFVSISVDPAYDTPDRLREYAEARGADLSTWSFLTGELPDVAEVLRRYYIGTIRKPDGTLDHLVATFLIDPGGLIVRRYLGLEHSSEDILGDIEEALS
jgi:protein SCO1/2